MNYVFLIYASESRYATMSPGEAEKLMGAYGTYTKELHATGRAGDCAALEPIGTATSVRVRDGKRVVADGPFAETKEQLGGYYAFDAKDEEEALSWASRIPDAVNGTMEVRPVMQLPPEGPEPSGASQDEAKGRREYILLIYENEQLARNMSEEEGNALMAAYGAFTASIVESKQYVAGAPLDPTPTGKSVRVNHGKRVTSDGPFAETKEQLGGYYRIFARDLDEAVATAARIPTATTGTIEVRPVRDTSAYA